MLRRGFGIQILKMGLICYTMFHKIGNRETNPDTEHNTNMDTLVICVCSMV